MCARAFTFMWLRGKIHVGEWCCEVVGSCEVELSCEVRCSTSSQPDKNLCVRVHVCVWQDQQQTLAAIDTLLQHQPITSQHLATFVDKHPDVVGQQGIKDDNDDLSQTADSEHLSDIVQSDIDTADITMPCDTADTTVNTKRTADTTMPCDTADTTVNIEHIGDSGDTGTADTSMSNCDTADTRVNDEHIVSTTTSRRHLSNR